MEGSAADTKKISSDLLIVLPRVAIPKAVGELPNEPYQHY